MFKFINILVPILLFTSRMYGQEAILSQPYSSSQYQNPAGVGGGEYDKRFQSNYKSQIMDGSSLYNTFLVSYDTRFKFDENNSKNYLGIGAQIISDQIMLGVMQNNYLSLNAAYHIYLDDELYSNFSLGIGVTFAQTTLDKSKLKFSDQYDYRAIYMGGATLENLRQFPSELTTNAGIMYTKHSATSFIQTGAMAYLYAKPNVTYSLFNEAERLRYRAFLSIETPIFYNKSFLFYYNYTNKNNLNQMYFGALIGMPLVNTNDDFIKVYGGCFYRNKEAIVPTISYISNLNTFGISYDVYINTLTGANLRQKGFELSYSRRFGSMRKNRFKSILN